MSSTELTKSNAIKAFLNRLILAEIQWKQKLLRDSKKSAIHLLEHCK